MWSAVGAVGGGGDDGVMSDDVRCLGLFGSALDDDAGSVAGFRLLVQSEAAIVAVGGR